MASSPLCVHGSVCRYVHVTRDYGKGAMRSGQCAMGNAQHHPTHSLFVNHLRCNWCRRESRVEVAGSSGVQRHDCTCHYLQRPPIHPPIVLGRAQCRVASDQQGTESNAIECGDSVRSPRCRPSRGCTDCSFPCSRIHSSLRCPSAWPMTKHEVPSRPESSSGLSCIRPVTDHD